MSELTTAGAVKMAKEVKEASKSAEALWGLVIAAAIVTVILSIPAILLSSGVAAFVFAAALGSTFGSGVVFTILAFSCSMHWSTKSKEFEAAKDSLSSD